jgi:hypothetical protein
MPEPVLWMTARLIESGQSGEVVNNGVEGLVLDVYDTKLGWWNPEHGDIEVPDEWDFLPSGDAFVTRTVKAAGVCWAAWLPRARRRPHRRRVGLWAPAATIRDAWEKAAATEDARAARRQVGAASRQRQEARYQQEFTQAVLAFLDFAPAHAPLAGRIAREAAGRAAVVGSERVGRTRTLPIEERAALAARAYIRHRFTDYEDQLEDLWEGLGDDEVYRQVKAGAQSEVDVFLQRHRLP